MSFFIIVFFVIKSSIYPDGCPFQEQGIWAPTIIFTFPSSTCVVFRCFHQFLEASFQATSYFLYDNSSYSGCGINILLRKLVAFHLHYLSLISSKRVI